MKALVHNEHFTMSLTARTGLSTRDALHMIDTGRLWSLRASGGPAVREELVRRFLPLARKSAMRYLGTSDQLDDLLQVAHLGLIGAVERFDPGRGTSFPAFAIPTMVGEIKRHFRNSGWAVHVPRRGQELALDVRQGSQDLSRCLGRAPSVPELAQYLERDIDEVVAGLEIGNVQYASSLDAPVVEDSPTPMVSPTHWERRMTASLWWTRRPRSVPRCPGSRITSGGR